MLLVFLFRAIHGDDSFKINLEDESKSNEICVQMETEKFDNYQEGNLCIPTLQDLKIDLPAFPHILNLTGNHFEFKVWYTNPNVNRPNTTCARQLYFVIIGPSMILAKVNAQGDFFNVTAYLQDAGLYKIEFYIEMEPVIIDQPFQIYVSRKISGVQREICHPDRGDYPGRWVLGTDPSAPMPVDYTEEGAVKDDYYTWEPYCCRYKEYKTYEQVMDCFEGKWIHMSGDSQSRYILVDILKAIKTDVPQTKWHDDRAFLGEKYLISHDFRHYDFDHDFGLNISEKFKYDLPYPWNQRRAPDVWIVNVGLWWLRYSRSSTEYREEMQNLLNIIRNNIPSSTRIILRTTTPSRRVSWRDPNILSAYNQALANLSWTNPQRILLLDGFSIAMNRAFDSSSDWLHFRRKVSVSIANIMLNVICN